VRKRLKTGELDRFRWAGSGPIDVRSYPHSLGNSDDYQNKGLANWPIRMNIKTKSLRAGNLYGYHSTGVSQKMKNAAEAAARETFTPFPVLYITRVGAAGQEEMLDGSGVCRPYGAWGRSRVLTQASRPGLIDAAPPALAGVN